MRDRLLGWALHALGSALGFWLAAGALWAALILFVLAAERVEYGADSNYAVPVGVAILGALLVALHRAFAGFPRPGGRR